MKKNRFQSKRKSSRKKISKRKSIKRKNSKRKSGKRISRKTSKRKRSPKRKLNKSMNDGMLKRKRESQSKIIFFDFDNTLISEHVSTSDEILKKDKSELIPLLWKRDDYLKYYEELKEKLEELKSRGYTLYIISMGKKNNICYILNILFPTIFSEVNVYGEDECDRSFAENKDKPIFKDLSNKKINFKQKYLSDKYIDDERAYNKSFATESVDKKNAYKKMVTIQNIIHDKDKSEIYFFDDNDNNIKEAITVLGNSYKIDFNIKKDINSVLETVFFPKKMDTTPLKSTSVETPLKSTPIETPLKSTPIETPLKSTPVETPLKPSFLNLIFGTSTPSKTPMKK